MSVIKSSTHTSMLQFLCTLLDIILGTSICDNYQHLRDVLPHATVRGEYLLVDMLQSNTWIKDG